MRSQLWRIPHLGRCGGLFFAVALALSGAALANEAPVVDSLTASPVTVAPGETTSLTVEAHDPDCPGECTSGCGQVIHAPFTQWWADAGSFTEQNNGATDASPYSATATWLAPDTEGSYTLTIFLSDNGGFICGGRKTITRDLTILVTTLVNQPPVIDSLTATPGRILPDESTTLTCSASDPDGDPVTLSWSTDLGSVTPSGPASAVFESTVPGVATVTCTASDPAGFTGDDSIGVSVTAAEAEKALTSGLSTPRRLTVDSRGAVYVVDGPGLSVLDLFSGELLYRLEIPGVQSVEVDWNDNLLIGTSFGARVVSRTGDLLLPLGPGAVSDVAVDLVSHSYGTLSGTSGRVTIYDEIGGLVASFGDIGDAPDQFRGPLGLAVTPAGEWVVADGTHGKIKLFNSSGTLLSAFGSLGGGAGEFIRLDDVEVDAAGVIWASDAFNSWLQAFEPSGTVRETLGTYGEGVGEFKTPAGIASAAAFDRLLATSANSSSIQVFVTRSTPAGPGPSPIPSLSSGSLDFADQPVGLTSTPHTLTLTNQGGGILAIQNVSSNGDFEASSDCTPFVEAGESCTISVRFTPAAAGPRLGSLILDTSAPGEPLGVVLTGNGFVPPDLRIEPGHLGYSDQKVGTISPAQQATVTNVGTLPLAIQAIQVDGEYSEAGDCPATLAGGAQCQLSVHFEPLSVTDANLGTITIHSDGLGSPHTLELSGASLPGDIEILVADATLEEGDDGMTDALFEVELTSPAGAPVSVDYLAVEGTATAGEDFEAVADTLTIPTGERYATIRVPVYGDLILEPDEETFELELSAPLNATLSTALATGTILDDELCLSPNLLANPGAEQRTDDGAIVAWSAIAGTWLRRFAEPAAYAGRAYFSAETLPEAELEQVVDLAPYADQIATGTQQFALSAWMQSADEAVPDTARMIAEYMADDGLVLDSFDSGEIASPAGWMPVLDVRAAPVDARWIRVRLLAARNSGESTDAFFDELELRSIRAATIDVDDLSAYEGDIGIQQHAFAATLSCPWYKDVDLTYVTADGSAVAGWDYLATGGTIAIPAGTSTAMMPVEIVGDLEVENDEDFALLVADTTPEEAVLLTNGAWGIVLDDDTCTRDAGYWKNHTEEWPVTWLLIGGVEYEWDALLALLRYGGPDAASHLARQLTATLLNLAAGSPPEILATVDPADTLLATYPPGSDPEDDARTLANTLTDALADYNDGSCGEDG